MTESFSKAYPSFYETVNKYSEAGFNILEIGGGAHPSLQSRSKINYTIVDPDNSELQKAPKDINKISSTVQDLDGNDKYELIVSKMVLEHIDDPDGFHKKVFELLSVKGKAIHFFACRHSMPAFANRYLNEKIGDRILTLLKNRNLSDTPKYEAYYRRTLGHTEGQIEYFKNIGYNVEMYQSYVGHTYFSNIGLLKQIEQIYTWFLTLFRVKRLTTVALVVLSK